MTPYEMRMGLAKTQRMLKTRTKWREYAEQVESLSGWDKHTQHSGVSIGDSVEFMSTKAVGNSIRLTKLIGVAFAFGETSMLVIAGGQLIKIPHRKTDGASK